MTDLPISPAETALSLLFRKLHPLLEDAAHAMSKKAPKRELERLHLKLLSARMKALEVLEEAMEPLSEEDPLFELLETLASNLTPVGENFQQSLTLTQLCLEEAPDDLLPFLPEGVACSAPWAGRMNDFLARLEDPAFGAEARWENVDEEIGETEEG